MNTPNMYRYAKRAEERGELLTFLHFAQAHGYKLCSEDPLLKTFAPRPDDIEDLLDLYHGIDRAQLQAERARSRELGAECACEG